jgi:hypothetical protein
MMLTLRMLEGLNCVAEMPTGDRWGRMKQWEGPFRLTPDGIVIDHFLGGYDGVRMLKGTGGILFIWPRLASGVPTRSQVVFHFDLGRKEPEVP